MVDKLHKSIGAILIIIISILFSSASAQQIKMESKDAESYFQIGKTHAQKGEYDQAILYFNKAIEINPSYADAYNGRGIVYDKKDYDDQAISDFNKALEIDPKFAKSYINRGNFYFKRKQYDKAISDYTKALEIDPNFTLAYFARGTAYGKKNQYDQAISDFGKALELDPRYKEAYYNRGMLYFLKGEYDKSLNDINKAQELGHQIDADFLDMLRSYTLNKPPNEDYLKTRVKNLYLAVAANDIKIMYAMEIPIIRKNITFEEWKKEARLDQMQQHSTKKVVQGELEKICKCEPWMYENEPQTLRCTLIVRITAEDIGGHQQIYRLLEMWEYLDGEWYHGFTDHHEWEDCPK